jgi:hypothetical protein
VETDRAAHAVAVGEIGELGSIGLDPGFRQALTGDGGAVAGLRRLVLRLGLVAGGELGRLVGELRDAVGERAPGEREEQRQCGEERDAIRPGDDLTVPMRCRGILLPEPCSATDDRPLTQARAPPKWCG